MYKKDILFLKVCATYVFPPELSGGVQAAASAAASSMATSMPFTSDLGRHHGGPHHKRYTSEGDSQAHCSQRLTVQEATTLSAASTRSIFDDDSLGPNLGSVKMHEPTMPQGLAWHLALQAVRRKLLQQAKGQILDIKGAGYGASGALDVHVDLQVCFSHNQVYTRGFWIILT